jgi:hypothetical protein
MPKKDETLQTPSPPSAEACPPLGRNRRVYSVYTVGELPEEIIDAIRRAEVDPKYAYLDEELKDWKP